jgi:apolipoprotein N-acyltransferase
MRRGSALLSATLRPHYGTLLSRHSAVCVLLATALYTLALPPFGVDWLAFLAAAPLAVLFLDPGRRLGTRDLIVASLLFGEGTTLAVGGHWLYHGAHEFFGRSAAASVAFTLLTTVTHAGILIAAAAMSAAALGRFHSRMLRVAGFACAWVAWELVRSRLLYGCPWDFLGHAVYRRPALMQAAAIGGAYALSWLCVACGAGIGIAWTERRRPARALVTAGIAVALPLAAAAFGGIRVARQQPVALPPLRVALVQPNVGRDELWDPRKKTDHLDQLLAMSRAPELAGADLIVWPENAVPFLLDADAAARERIGALARERNAFVLTGAPRSAQDRSGHARLYNSVYLFSPDGGEAVTYDKVKLLPYIERTPAWAVPFLSPNRALETSPGAGPRLFDIRGWRIAPLICFESTYPELARAAVAAGADALLNVSNDSWFEAGAAPQQHFAMTVMRAPELGLPVVRAANTGISAVTDSAGRILGALPSKRAVAAVIEVPPRIARSTYAKVGDVFAWACVSIAVGLLLVLTANRGGKE